MATYPTFKRLQKTSKDFKALQRLPNLSGPDLSKDFKDFEPF